PIYVVQDAERHMEVLHHSDQRRKDRFPACSNNCRSRRQGMLGFDNRSEERGVLGVPFNQDGMGPEEDLGESYIHLLKRLEVTLRHWIEFDFVCSVSLTRQGSLIAPAALQPNNGGVILEWIHKEWGVGRHHDLPI